MGQPSQPQLPDLSTITPPGDGALGSGDDGSSIDDRYPPEQEENELELGDY